MALRSTLFYRRSECNICYSGAGQGKVTLYTMSGTWITTILWCIAFNFKNRGQQNQRNTSQKTKKMSNADPTKCIQLYTYCRPTVYARHTEHRFTREDLGYHKQVTYSRFGTYRKFTTAKKIFKAMIYLPCPFFTPCIKKFQQNDLHYKIIKGLRMQYMLFWCWTG
jgi:hypothetical protein